ncbi:MAG: alpha/beta fold hydrolase [Alcanivoracaceae bacterium]
MAVTTGTVKSNGIDLFYESRGPASGEPIVFVMGLSAQMVFWPEPLLDMLADKGYRVVRFDNRDVGLSTKLRAENQHDPAVAVMRYFFGLPVRSAYNLHDMVADTTGLLDALEIDRAHMVGASMGGMISQLMSARRPERVRSLTSIMSSPNTRWPLAPPKPSALKALVGPKVKIRDADQFVEFGRWMMRTLGGSMPTSDTLAEQMFRQSWERGLHPRGVRQQLMAVLSTGAFRHELKNIRVPATVIHGSDDPLIRPASGRASARAIPGARFELIRGMGHDLPDQALPKIASLIEETARRAN